MYYDAVHVVRLTCPVQKYTKFKLGAKMRDKTARTLSTCVYLLTLVCFKSRGFGLSLFYNTIIIDLTQYSRHMPVESR